MAMKAEGEKRISPEHYNSNVTVLEKEPLPPKKSKMLSQILTYPGFDWQSAKSLGVISTQSVWNYIRDVSPFALCAEIEA